MVQRNGLAFVYCFVDDEEFAFICLIIFLFPSRHPQFPNGNDCIYSACLTCRPYQQPVDKLQGGEGCVRPVTSWESSSDHCPPGAGGCRVEMLGCPTCDSWLQKKEPPCLGGDSCSVFRFPHCIWISLLVVGSGVFPSFHIPWDLRIWLYLETDVTKIRVLRWAHTAGGWALNSTKASLGETEKAHRDTERRRPG